jgi:multiple sugar transport system permease protein
MSATVARRGEMGSALAHRRPALRLKLYAYGLLLPATLAVLFLVVYPLARVFELSLREGRMMNFARISDLPLGLGNYQRVLGDAGFWNSVSVSAIYVGGSVAVAFAIGLGTALLLNRHLPGRRWLRTFILLPWAVPGVIASIVFLWMLDSSFGVVNAMLRDVGLLQGDHAWFVDERTALISVMLPTIWKAYPLITLTLLAAMQSIPDEFYEAAWIDGARSWQAFLHITWPGIQGAAILAIMISVVWVFREIDIIYAATRGGPARATETLAVYVYNEAFQYFRMGVASAVGTIMIGLALLVSLFAVALARRDRF